MKQHILLLLLFIFSLVFFHLLFVFVAPKSKKFWIRIDYYWVSLSLLSIITLVYNIRKELASGEIERQRARVVADYQIYAGAIESLFNYTHEVNLDLEQKIFWDTRTKTNFLSSEIFLKNHLNALNRYKPEIVDKNEYKFIDSIKLSLNRYVSTLQDDKSSLIGFEIPANTMQYLTDSKDKMVQLYIESSRNTFETITYFLSPFILTVAAALRITKVTGQLRLEKASSNG